MKGTVILRAHDSSDAGGVLTQTQEQNIGETSLLKGNRNEKKETNGTILPGILQVKRGERNSNTDWNLDCIGLIASRH